MILPQRNRSSYFKIANGESQPVMNERRNELIFYYFLEWNIHAFVVFIRWNCDLSFWPLCVRACERACLSECAALQLLLMLLRLPMPRPPPLLLLSSNGISYLLTFDFDIFVRLKIAQEIKTNSFETLQNIICVARMLVDKVQHFGSRVSCALSLPLKSKQQQQQQRQQYQRWWPHTQRNFQYFRFSHNRTEMSAISWMNAPGQSRVNVKRFDHELN